ncbi:MAG: radical SAM protein [Kiritimatiellae bacterium]|nr:radical SAM protein [Kiritimatiellia bacterium]
MASPKTVTIPESFNYIGIFLTFRCPYHCSYCINQYGSGIHLDYPEISGTDWVNFFRRLPVNDIPVTLQGGEPGLHPNFFSIVRDTLEFHAVDILTNLAFDLDRFIGEIDPARINRPAPYAPVRVSYHPEQFSLPVITKKILRLMNAGFRIGLYGVTHPDQLILMEEAEKTCKTLGIDFRLKPFLGRHHGELHGRYTHPDACDGKPPRACECATSELLAAPDGSIHRCHTFCYRHLQPIASIYDPQIALTDDFIPCNLFGQCNPCDIKVKNNRFQQFGHVATRIQNIHPL